MLLVALRLVIVHVGRFTDYLFIYKRLAIMIRPSHHRPRFTTASWIYPSDQPSLEFGMLLS